MLAFRKTLPPSLHSISAHAQKAKGSDCLYEFVPPTIFENEKKNPGGFETPENC